MPRNRPAPAALRRLATLRPVRIPPLTARQAADLRRLAAYRLERTLTFDALAAEMTKAGFPVLSRALHLTLTGRLKTRPRDTTLYKIAQFVARLPRVARSA